MHIKQLVSFVTVARTKKYGADRLGSELFALHDFWTFGIFGKRV